MTWAALRIQTFSAYSHAAAHGAITGRCDMKQDIKSLLHDVMRNNQVGIVASPGASPARTAAVKLGLIVGHREIYFITQKGYEALAAEEEV